MSSRKRSLLSMAFGMTVADLFSLTFMPPREAFAMWIGGMAALLAVHVLNRMDEVFHVE